MTALVNFLMAGIDEQKLGNIFSFSTGLVEIPTPRRSTSSPQDYFNSSHSAGYTHFSNIYLVYKHISCLFNSITKYTRNELEQIINLKKIEQILWSNNTICLYLQWGLNSFQSCVRVYHLYILSWSWVEYINIVFWWCMSLVLILPCNIVMNRIVFAVQVLGIGNRNVTEIGKYESMVLYLDC
jgi:hypothetical protein